jgi:uncharacterized membrane protein
MVSQQPDIMDMTDILDKDIEAIVALRMNAERKVSGHQRIIEKATSILGRPLAVYITILAAIVWMAVNIFHRSLGLPVFDAPPFSWLQEIVGLSALLMTIIVLTTQNRQAKFTEQRRHLDLQISLLTERKVSKLIELLEDLRRDLPTVYNRVDTEAEAMKEPIDPHTALSALNQTLQEAAEEYQFDIE